jgi:hypothetical protein
LALRDAIVGALDIWDLFEGQGGIVLIANGAMHAINSEQMRWILTETFVTKHVVRKLLGLRYEVDYRAVNPSEMAVRALLRADSRDGGLIGYLPVLNIEEPLRAPVPPEKQLATSSPLPEIQRELDAGARQVARRSDASRREEELKRGAEVVEKYRRGRQVAVETAPVVEEYPIHAPIESKAAEDPAEPPQA